MRIILSKILKINKCLFLIMFNHDYGTFVVADTCAIANDELHIAILKKLP